MSVTTWVSGKASCGSRTAPTRSARSARCSRSRLASGASSVPCVVTNAMTPPEAQFIQRFGEELVVDATRKVFPIPVGRVHHPVIPEGHVARLCTKAR